MGVISVPEIHKHEVKKDDVFMVLASDGVWEFIDNKEAIELVGKHSNNMHTACSKLVTLAHKKWTMVCVCVCVCE